MALESRKTIAKVIGMIISRRGWDEPSAFGSLVRRSQEQNLKVRALCEQLLHQFETDPVVAPRSLDRMMP